MKQDGYINGLSLSVKSSNIPQKCFYCDEAITKGEKRIKMTDGAYFNHPTYAFYHVKCFRAGIAKVLKGGDA
jgi:hypothetical protein